MPVPICILTSDRPDYLACTLHSLAGTDLPKGVSVTVFDDGSQSERAMQYLYSDQPMTVDLSKVARIDALRQLPRVVPGLKGRVRVVRRDSAIGVMAASCNALLALKSEEPGTLLLQDDVLFNPDWYKRMTTVGERDRVGGKRIGVLAGVQLNRRLARPGLRARAIPVSTATAQCLFFLREAVAAIDGWLQQPPVMKRQFDDKVFAAVAGAGFATAVLFPFCCQHIGCVSSVRPERSWTYAGSAGRIGFYSSPPYAMSGEVRFD